VNRPTLVEQGGECASARREKRSSVAILTFAPFSDGTK